MFGGIRMPQTCQYNPFIHYCSFNSVPNKTYVKLLVKIFYFGNFWSWEGGGNDQNKTSKSLLFCFDFWIIR